MDLGLSGKGVVVTGGSKDIGRAMALAFAGEGAAVAICARGAEALAKVEKELQELTDRAYCATRDVGAPTRSGVSSVPRAKSWEASTCSSTTFPPSPWETTSKLGRPAWTSTCWLRSWRPNTCCPG